MSKEYVMQLESTIENLRRDNKILKEELSKYKAIDNSNPSEALKELEEIENYINNIIFAKDLRNQKQQLLTNITIIKQALLKAQEQEKVLKIIKEKGVDVATFNTYQTVIEYNWNIRFEKYKRKELTEEEFELVKRYFDER